MLQLQFNIVKSTDCTSFGFVQTTGVYTLTTNEGGWGAPNDELVDVQDSYINITSVTADQAYELVEVTASASATDDIAFQDLIKVGETTSIGTSDIIDGIYSFQHVVLMNDSSLYNTTEYVLSLCEIECKLKQLSIKYIDSVLDNCTCKETLLNSFVEANALYKSLLYAFQCGRFDEFNNILNNLQSLLSIIDCENC
jgi:hypothetical protein